MPDGHISLDLMTDAGGTVWVGTTRGLCRIAVAPTGRSVVVEYEPTTGPPHLPCAVSDEPTATFYSSKVAVVAGDDGLSTWRADDHQIIVGWLDGAPLVIDDVAGELVRVDGDVERTIAPSIEGGLVAAMDLGEAVGILLWSKDGHFTLVKGAVGRPFSPDIQGHIAAGAEPFYVYRHLDGVVFGTSGGLFFVELDGRIRYHVGPEGGIPPSILTRATVDRHGSIWLTGSAGVTRVDHSRRIRRVPVTSSPVIDVVTLDDQMVVATDVGIDFHRWSVAAEPVRQIDGHVGASLCVYDGRVYSYGYSGFFELSDPVRQIDVGTTHRVAFLGEGLAATLGDEQILKVIDVATAEVVHQHTVDELVRCLAASTSGEIWWVDNLGSVIGLIAPDGWRGTTSIARAACAARWVAVVEEQVLVAAEDGLHAVTHEGNALALTPIRFHGKARLSDVGYIGATANGELFVGAGRLMRLFGRIRDGELREPKATWLLPSDPIEGPFHDVSSGHWLLATSAGVITCDLDQSDTSSLQVPLIEVGGTAPGDPAGPAGSGGTAGLVRIQLAVAGGQRRSIQLPPLRSRPRLDPGLLDALPGDLRGPRSRELRLPGGLVHPWRRSHERERRLDRGRPAVVPDGGCVRRRGRRAPRVGARDRLRRGRCGRRGSRGGWRSRSIGPRSGWRKRPACARSSRVSGWSRIVCAASVSSREGWRTTSTTS